MVNTEAPKIAIIGCGSLRLGAPVIASVFAAKPPTGTVIHLTDPEPERLDLFERLARMLTSELKSETLILADDNSSEAIRGATHVALCFGLGRKKARLSEWESSGASLTPELRELARAILLNDIFEHINDRLAQSAEPMTLVNFVRPIQLTSQLLSKAARHVRGPELADEERVPKAHEILRWIKGDEYVHDLLKGRTDTEVYEAIWGEMEAHNYFSPRAVANWVSQLEDSGIPDVRALLLPT